MDSFYNFEISTLEEISESVIKGLKTLLSTVAGTVALDRDFGLSTDFLDAPESVVQNFIATEIVIKVKKYEPRVKIKSVNLLGTNSDGKINVKVVVANV